MNIICHRGLWKKKNEQNQLKACLAAAEKFEGLEIDLRSLNGKIVLSHDPIAKNQKLLSLEELFAKIPATHFALNIKEDGLAPLLKKLIEKYQVQDYFCFDLSTPEFLAYEKQGLKVYPRVGDQDPPLGNRMGQGLVVDVFNPRNLKRILANLLLKPSTPVFFISPELHGHPPLASWKQMKKFAECHPNPLYLCTDLFQEARDFFPTSS